jgi:hypothetical protein
MFLESIGQIQDAEASLTGAFACLWGLPHFGRKTDPTGMGRLSMESKMKVSTTVYTCARSILGKDFHSFDGAMRHFGAMSDGAFLERLPLRLRNQRMGKFLSEEQTVAILKECQGTHVLMPTHPSAATIRDVYRCHQSHFWNGQNSWFTQNRESWATAPSTDPWLLVRKEIVPGSTGIPADQQPNQLERDFPGERLLLPGEFAYAALLHFLETKERLCVSHAVRFHAQVSGGDWVGADWNGGRLNVDRWFSDADEGAGSASARTS